MLAHHGHGSKPCPLCDANNLDPNPIAWTPLKVHQHEIGFKTPVDSVHQLLTQITDCNIHFFLYKFSQSDTLCTGLDRENLVYTQPNIKSMVSRFNFFKPRRPKLCQIGQTRYQSTPLYLYIQNIKLVCQSDTLCTGLDRENLVYT